MRKEAVQVSSDVGNIPSVIAGVDIRGMVFIRTGFGIVITVSAFQKL